MGLRWTGHAERMG